MDATVTVSRADLEKALRTWDKEAAEHGFPERADDGRFADSADYLFNMLDDLTA